MSKESTSTPQISQRFSSASAPIEAGTPVSAERADRINKWADLATAQIVKNYTETRTLWTNQQYSELLAREGERRSLQPGWATDDRKAHLMRAASYIVHRRFEAKLDKINRIADRLLSGKTLEANKEELGR